MTDADSARLRELGYEQQLDRQLRVVDTVALGIAGISPVVGLYAVVLVGSVLAGPSWVWVLPVALAGQCLLIFVYGELARDFPLTGGAYQWTRRLVGERYGWFAGWVAICAYAAANTTVAYLGAPWALTLLGIEATAGRIVVTGVIFVLVCALAGAFGVRLLGQVVKAGIVAEVIAVVGIGLVLLLAFREQEFSILTDPPAGGAFLAALAVGGWVFIGFDVAAGAAEETQGASRHVPRAIWIALLGVGALVILNAVAVGLAHPDGESADPVTTAVVSSFGDWSDKPFAAVVLIAFLSCGIAAQALTARTMYSVSRDGTLPRQLQRVDRRRVPVVAVAVTAVFASAGLLLGLDAAAVGTLISFGTAAIYVSFLLTAVAALVARLRGTWGSRGIALTINVLAVAWLAFETVNIAWPRESIAPPGAPFYQVWAAPLLLATITVAGFLYVAVRRPGS